MLALGRPTKTGMQASWGIVTAIGGPARTGRGGLLDEYIQTETVSYPGFSGGPLVNTEGEMLGLNTSGLAHGNALTIPSRPRGGLQMRWRKHGSVKRGYLGVRTQTVDLPEASRQSLRRDQQQGLLGPVAGGRMVPPHKAACWLAISWSASAGSRQRSG